MIRYILRLLVAMVALGASSVGAVIIDGAHIDAAVTDTLLAIASFRDVDVEIDVSASDIDLRETGSFNMMMELTSDDPLDRRVPVKLTFSDENGNIVRLSTVVAKVRTFANAAIAATDVDAETPITEQCVSFKRIDVSRQDGYITSLDALDNMRTKRRLKAGSVLLDRTIEPIPLVFRGATVTIYANVGNVTVTADGTARQDGGNDQSIRVFSEATRKTITCRVIGPGAVIALK